LNRPEGLERAALDSQWRRHRPAHRRAVDRHHGRFPCKRYRHKSGAKYGYATVLTDGQSVVAQVGALRAAEATNAFREVASGAMTAAAAAQAISALQADDVLMVTRLDRLALSTRWPLSPVREQGSREELRQQTQPAADLAALPGATGQVTQRLISKNARLFPLLLISEIDR